MERVRLSQLVHTRQASRSSSTIQKHTSNHTPRAVRMNDGEKEEALLVRSLRSTASQLWRKHQASPPVEFHTPRLRPKRASILLQESNPRDRSDSRNLRLPFLLLPRTCHLDHPRIISHLFFAFSAGSCRAEARRFADLLFVISRYLSPELDRAFQSRYHECLLSVHVQLHEPSRLDLPLRPSPNIPRSSPRLHCHATIQSRRSVVLPETSYPNWQVGLVDCTQVRSLYSHVLDDVLELSVIAILIKTTHIARRDSDFLISNLTKFW